MHVFWLVVACTTIYIILGVATGMLGLKIWSMIDGNPFENDTEEFAVGMFALWVVFWPAGIVAGIVGGIGYLIFLTFRETFRFCLKRSIHPS